MSNNQSFARPKLLPSTQLLLTGAISEGIAVLMLVLSMFVSVGSPSTIITTFLITSILGIIASSVAMIMAVVGMVRYRRLLGWNIALLVCSIIFNPFLWGLLVFLAL